MSQISVVQYSPPTPKILHQNTTTNQGKTGDRHIIVLRKPAPILPQPKDIPKEDILLTNPGRKGAKKAAKDSKTNPQPMAVARRNARERNRVKQVNNGFANLRQHIPNFIAQTFESGNGRGNKKLSKVETLRMAVEYIRSLEELLAMDGYALPYSDEANLCSSPTSQNESSENQCYSFGMSDEDDDFSSVATASPQQYIRINTTNNSYEVVPISLYENSENMDPSISSEQHSILLDSGLDLNSQDLSYLQVSALQNTAGSLSPELYSENSLSPNSESKMQEGLPQNCFIPVFTSGRLGDNFNVHVKTEISDLPTILLKEEESPKIEQNIQANWWEQTIGRSDTNS
ncbi:achaete-scute complex protein T4-like [Anthonomus grandis grandis]|uniref:achaete-scute complex protein T4-like n=1 Tax=Anthonomus grandis grandis TaxID=2921223 RepID=UPI00216585C7|nr:achaete-scute complex protein T4-like [Anthonomus grandis grandis]